MAADERGVCVCVCQLSEGDARTLGDRGGLEAQCGRAEYEYGGEWNALQRVPAYQFSPRGRQKQEERGGRHALGCFPQGVTLTELSPIFPALKETLVTQTGGPQSP